MELAFALLEDPSIEVKEICLKELIKQGVEIEPDQVRKALTHPTTDLASILLARSVDPDMVILALYKSFGYDRLLAEIDWYSVDGPIAYRELALDYFNKVSDRIRYDLDDRFEALKQKSAEKLGVQHRVSAEQVVELSREHDDFIRTRFTSAALAGFAMHGESQDVQIGRLYLMESDHHVRLEAIRIIERFGDASDVEALIGIAKDSYGELKELAANVALKLAPRIDGAASALLQTEDPTLVGLSFKSLMNEPPTEVQPILEPLLGSKNDNIRIKVLAYFVKRYLEDELVQLLSRYFERSHYYYDVVCWLDRVLYAPPPLKEMFVYELKVKLD